MAILKWRGQKDSKSIWRQGHGQTLLWDDSKWKTQWQWQNQRQKQQGWKQHSSNPTDLQHLYGTTIWQQTWLTYPILQLTGKCPHPHHHIHSYRKDHHIHLHHHDYHHDIRRDPRQAATKRIGKPNSLFTPHRLSFHHHAFNGHYHRWHRCHHYHHNAKLLLRPLTG